MSMTKKQKKQMNRDKNTRLYDKWVKMKTRYFGFMLRGKKEAFYFVLIHYLSVRMAIWEASGMLPYVYCLPIVFIMSLFFSQLMFRHINLNRHQKEQDRQMRRISRAQDELNMRLVRSERWVKQSLAKLS